MQEPKKKSIPTFKSESFLIKIVERDGVLGMSVQADQYFRHFLREYAKPGMEGSMKLELRKPKRTVLQNNFYWLYLSLIASASGYTTEELHSWVKGKFLTKGIKEVFGNKVRKTSSTTNLSRTEFTELLINIETDTEIPIPDPSPFGLGLTMAEYDDLKQAQKIKYSSLKAKIK